MILVGKICHFIEIWRHQQYKLNFFNYFMKLNTLYEILNNSVKNFSERIAFSLWRGASYTYTLGLYLRMCQKKK